MSSEPDYNYDSEFVKLLTRRTDIDLAAVALEVARDAEPELSFLPTFRWLDARAEEIAGAVARAKSEAEALRELSDCIASQHGIFGDADAYSRPEGSFLHRVIQTKRGIPLSLSLLYAAVAERLGMELRGVAAPMHFLTRYESIEGPLFIDAFNRGRVLTYGECAQWIGEMVGQSPESIQPSLRSARPRTIVIRMLNNLKTLYSRQQNWADAWNVQHRLAALQPGAYGERRDLALMSLQTNRPGHAIDLLQSCISDCPDDERQTLLRHLDEASHQVALLN